MSGRKPAPKSTEANLDGLYKDLAVRFSGLSQLFGQLGTPEAVADLFASLVSDDAEPFNKFIDPFEIPVLGKCLWVREVIERVVVTPTGLVQECWLRDDLTPAERWLYIRIAMRHRQLTPVGVGVGTPTFQIIEGHAIIPPGPFLDELQANGLVTCETRMTYETSTVLGFSKPERVCI
jgi:hypothetical protein